MNQGKINEKYIAVRGKTAIAEELELDQDVTVTVCVQEIADKSLNDGTVDRTYRAVLFAPDEWDGKKITVKQGKTPSQKLRAVLFLLWKQLSVEEPFDTWYAKKMEDIIEKFKEKLSD